MIGLKDLDLMSTAKGLDARLSIHTVREIVVDSHSGYIFPLKKRYDATNRTIEGALDAEADEGNTWDLPPVVAAGEPDANAALEGETAESVAEAPIDDDTYIAGEIRRDQAVVRKPPTYGPEEGLQARRKGRRTPGGRHGQLTRRRKFWQRWSGCCCKFRCNRSGRSSPTCAPCGSPSTS